MVLKRRVYSGVVASVGILSNAVILITVWTDQRLRNSTCWFICSLAAADIVVLTCVVPFAAIQDLAGHWPYQDDFCNTWIVFDLTFSVASLLSIFLLAIDKYLTIKVKRGAYIFVALGKL
jgi:7 transmembrane receptor (rhodopsin family)